MQSEESRQFLVETRMYLIRYGKRDRDIEAALEELEKKLVEGEENGKRT
ncbi:hypothetical protein [Planococcus lenghuensis]|nr:hypothetical protein [Planococcus lenghuensis]